MACFTLEQVLKSKKTLTTFMPTPEHSCCFLSWFGDKQDLNELRWKILQTHDICKGRWVDVGWWRRHVLPCEGLLWKSYQSSKYLSPRFRLRWSPFLSHRSREASRVLSAILLCLSSSLHVLRISGTVVSTHVSRSLHGLLVPRLAGQLHRPSDALPHLPDRLVKRAQQEIQQRHKYIIAIEHSKNMMIAPNALSTYDNNDIYQTGSLSNPPQFDGAAKTCLYTCGAISTLALFLFMPLKGPCREPNCCSIHRVVWQSFQQPTFQQPNIYIYMYIYIYAYMYI